MADVMDREQRRRLMASIKQRDTAPERVVRQGLHRLGLRFRVNVDGLPGRPDLVFPKYATVVFVHGCFWHGHRCRAGRAPSTNLGYWTEKLQANRARDRRQSRQLRRLGWHVLTVWECRLKPPADATRTLAKLARRIVGGRSSSDV